MQKKPWLLYLLVVWGIILDIISFLFLIFGLGNALGFIVSTVGFFTFFIVIGMHILDVTQYIARKKMKHKQTMKKQKNPIVQKQMKKARKKFADAVGVELIKMKSRKILYSVLAKIVTIIPILGSFVPAYTIKALVILRQNKKFMQVIEKMDLSVTGAAKAGFGATKGMVKQKNTSQSKNSQSQSQNDQPSNQYMKDAQELQRQGQKLISSMEKSPSQYRDNPHNSLSNIVQEKVDENEPDAGKRRTGAKSHSDLYHAKYDQSQPPFSSESSPEDLETNPKNTQDLEFQESDTPTFNYSSPEGLQTNPQNTQDYQSQNQDSSSSNESSVLDQNSFQVLKKSKNRSESPSSSENSSYSDINPQNTTYTSQMYQGDSQDVFDQIDPSSQSSSYRNSRSASHQQSSDTSGNLSSGTINLKSSFSSPHRVQSKSSQARSRTSQSQPASSGTPSSSSKTSSKNTRKSNSGSQSRTKTSQSSGKSGQFIRPSVGNSSKKSDI